MLSLRRGPSASPNGQVPDAATLSGPEQLVLKFMQKIGINPDAIMQMVRDVFFAVKSIKEDIETTKNELQQLRSDVAALDKRLCDLRDSIQKPGG